MPKSHIKSLINNKVQLLDKAWWTNNPHRHTNYILGTNKQSIIKTLNRDLINSKARYRTAINLITGHAGLNKHLNTMTLIDTTSCTFCYHDEETVSHFFGQCPTFMQTRGKYFNTYYASVNDIFNQFNINSIISYAHSTKRFLLAEDRDESGVT